MPYAFEVALTEVLFASGQKLDETTVTKYLQDNLHYEITSGDGTMGLIKIENLKTFKVGCYTTVGKYPDIHTSLLPSEGEKKYLYEITNGKGGGIKSPDELNNPVMMDGRHTKVGYGDGLRTY